MSAAAVRPCRRRALAEASVMWYCVRRPGHPPQRGVVGMREGCGKVFVNEFGFQGRTKGRERRKQKGRGGLRVLLRVKAEAGREKKGGGNERQKRTRTRKGERRASDKSRVKGRERFGLPVCALIDVLLKNLNLCGTGTGRKTKWARGKNLQIKSLRRRGRKGCKKSIAGMRSGKACEC